MMKTIQMTIDEQLLLEVDQAVRELGISRSAFLRDALREALKQLQVMEQQHIAGYKRHPVKSDEFDVWQETA
jgi:metal-responsive CopG/Arc/MetJ family transcriptional regulator